MPNHHHQPWYRIRWIPLLLCLLCALTAARADEDEPAPALPAPLAPAPWHEGRVVLPPLPAAGDWRVLPARLPGGWRLRLAPETLVVTAAGVVRYALRLDSPAGAHSRFYEGLRCSPPRIRTYAYAGRGRWISLPDQGWVLLARHPAGRYRRPLLDFLCDDEGRPLPVKEIRQRLRWGAPALDIEDE